MDRDRFEELCSAFVLGALESDELIEFEKHLATADGEELRLYRELYRVALHLPVGVEPAEPGPGVRAKILAAVSASRGVTEPRFLDNLAARLGFGRPLRGLAVSFALLLIAAGLGYYAILLRSEIGLRERQTAKLRNDLVESRERFTALSDELAQKTELLAILQAPRIDIVSLTGLDVNPAGYGKIIWDPERRRAILQISNLPAVPEGKDYQLWVIRKKQPIDAGVFTITDPTGPNFFKIDRLAESDRRMIDAFAVTLEPKGGVPQPTGAMYLLGSPTP